MVGCLIVNLYNKIIDWYLNKATDQTYRFFGIVILIIGTAIFSWVFGLKLFWY